MDNVHDSGVFGWIEHPNISFVHMQPWKPSFGCSLAQRPAGVLVPLDCNDGPVPEDEIGEEPTSGAGKQVHGLEHFTTASKTHSMPS